jgi:uncharacterized protein
MEFEWDDAKAKSNKVKHDLSFEDASQVFFDPNHMIEASSRETDNEERFKVVGMVKGRILTLVFTYRDNRVRVISARRSRSQEEGKYGNR